MNRVEIAKHLLLEHNCHNCVYRSAHNFSEGSEYCILDNHPKYDNSFVINDICNMYIHFHLWDKAIFFESIKTNPVKTFNEIRDFVNNANKYKETNMK